MSVNLTTLPGWIVPALVFASVAIFFFVFATGLLDRRKVRDRFAAAGAGSLSGTAAGSRKPGSAFDIDPQKLGLDLAAQRQLRTNLIRAGILVQTRWPCSRLH